MEQDEFFDFGESMEIVRRRKWPFLLSFGVVFAIGMAFALLLPPSYRSEAQVLVERQDIPTDLVSSTVTGYVQERIEVISQRVFTREKLREVGLETGVIEPPADEQEAESDQYKVYVAETVANMSDSISVEMVEVEAAERRSLTSITVAFIVAFEHSDPKIARAVTRELTDLFLSENASLRAEQAGRVTEFLQDAANRVREEIAQIEARITKLKEQSFEFLPDQLTQARADLSQLETSRAELNREIVQLDAQKEQLANQLARTNRYVITERSTLGELQDPLVRLEKAQLDLRAALETYTDEHPDVRRLRQLIADLQADIRRSSTGTQSDRLSEPTNPEYIRIQTQFNDVSARLIAAQSGLDLLQQRIGDLTRKLMQNPGVELTYNSLLRDLERAQNEFKDIRDRQYQAELAQSLEAQEKGERFTLLTSASLPLLPERPNRIGIALLGAFFGFIAGGIAVVLAESRDNTVRTLKDVQRLFGQKPIGVIPVIDMTNI